MFSNLEDKKIKKEAIKLGVNKYIVLSKTTPEKGVGIIKDLLKGNY